MKIFTVDLYDDNNLWLTPEPTLQADVYAKWKSDCYGFDERTFRMVKGTDQKGFIVPLHDRTTVYLNKTWQVGEHFTYTPQALALFTVLKQLTRIDHAKAEKRWKYLFEGEESDFTYPTMRRPFPQQTVGLEAALNREYFGLLMEMGTGKTKIIVDEIGMDGLDLRPDETIRYLIVCPRSLKINWKREFALNIAPFIPLEVRIFDTNVDFAANQLWLLSRSTARLKVGIISYDFLRGTFLPLLILWKPHYLALDESHYVKNHRSKRWVALKKLALIAERRRILSGTPVANNLLDLWAQFELLKPGSLGFSTYNGFKREYCHVRSIIDPVTQKPSTFDKIEGYKNVEDLKKNMAMCSFIVKKEHCLKFLPKKLFETRRIELPPAVRAQYEELKKNFTLKLEEDTQVNAQFVLVQMLKLAQVCCGFAVAETTQMTPVAVDDDGNVCDEEEVIRKMVILEGGDAKMNEMIEDAVETIVPYGKLVIWARFNYDCDEIKKRFDAQGIESVMYDGRQTNEKVRQSYVDRFNQDSAVRVFISKASSGGVGLTLLGDQRVDTDRCKTAFFYSNTFNNGQREQAEDRCHRIGQHSPVLYRDYVYEDTIEVEIAEALQEKRLIAAELKNVSTIKELLLGRG